MELGLYNKNGWLIPYTTDRTSTLFVGDAHDTLVRLALDDIYADRSVVFMGDIQEILEKIPKHRQEDCQVIKPSLQPFALNILNHVLLDALKGIWGYDRTATPVLDMYLRAGILTMQEVNLSFLHFKRFLTEYEYRQWVVSCLKDKFLIDFWRDYDALSDKDKRQDISSTLNKLWAFLLDERVRNCLVQKDNRIKDGIVLVDLDEETRPLGAFILADLYYRDTTLYLEDAHLYGAFVKQIINRIPTLFSVRYLDQFPRDTIPTVLGVEQIVSFRVGVDDYDRMSQLFNIPPGGIFPFELQDDAIVARFGSSTLIETRPSTHPYTLQDAKILRRCKSQDSVPIEKIQKLLGDLYA